jgi:hypothetical protein
MGFLAPVAVAVIGVYWIGVALSRPLPDPGPATELARPGFFM